VAPGEVLPRANVIIRNGIIVAVGPDAAIPADALRIDLEGKTVSAAFVDALSHWGIDASLRRSAGGPPGAEDLAAEPLIATKPDDRKALTPEFAVATALKSDNDTLDSWRKLGVGARLAALEGSIFTGHSAVISLGSGTPRETVLRTPFGQHVAFRPPPGSDYPRVLMGVFAHARQFMIDGQHYARMKVGSRGRRLPFDPALEALGSALDRSIPVVFEADTRDEIHRALDFAAEFQLRPVIAGGRQAWKVADRLKQERVPVILRVGLTEANEEREAELTDRVRLERNRIRHEERTNPKKLAEAGVEFAFGSMGSSPDAFRESVRQWIAAGLSPQAAHAALTTAPARLFQLEREIGAVRTEMTAQLIVTSRDPLAADAKPIHAFIDGERFDFADDGGAATTREPRRQAASPVLPESFVGPFSAADFATEIEADRRPSIRTGGHALLQGATVLTVANGTLVNCDILVKQGRIERIGTNLVAEPGVTVLNCRGLFVMPGIIDTHSHFAVSGGVNEYSLSVVPEVRISDVIDGDDVQIYRAAAGGVTTARLLHGSANCIGGQDAVIKMKYGLAGRDLMVRDGPRGVKFALGENVKRTDGRFPNTRLGVEAVLVRAFSEAREYRKAWDQYRSANRAGGSEPPEPRRDLRLEALSDILDGRILIHCHCYRADEILMLLRVADQFGIKIRSLQHALEGYKVAPEIAAHGASCSLFSDWWAYKIEAYDAIPFAAALMHAAGVPICLKSDSNELMRHMTQEAAKLVKYGGMDQNEAIKTITLNGARQLGLERRIGSIEVGKDADFAVFNGHPLNGYARCEMTMIEGEIYFLRDRTLAAAPVAQPAPPSPSASLTIPGDIGSAYQVVDATLHPVSGPARQTNLIVRDGRIAAIGSVSDLPRVSARGLHVYPGMIDAGTVLGLTELDSARETLDFREGGDFQPDLRAITAVNPDSELIPVTRANGVLSAVTRPTGSVIAGQGALINLAGWVPRDMTVIDPVALHVELPSGLPFFASSDPSVGAMGRSLARKQRDEKVRRLKSLFAQALAHDAARGKGQAPSNPRLDALVPYARGEKPVIISADRQSEIAEALKLADELRLKLILSGATDAWKVADEIKRRNVPVITGPTMALPGEREDPYDAPYANPARLHAAGIRFCIRSEGKSNARNLPYNAAIAVAHGLPAEEALKAVTMYPAQILGADDQLGSLDVGKRANFVITNGDLLQPGTQTLAIAVDGKLMAPESKQTRLYDRYRQRLREVSEGKAKLGTR
jgi:imidazolonepropionase-like amidohydrolase